MTGIKVAVIGCGGVGARHADGVSAADAELVAGCDLSEETLKVFGESLRERWPDIALYADYREMLRKEQPDIVTVATPDDRHAELVVDAVNAGARGIFCEKPLATTLADADRMIAACEAGNVVLSVDHTRRFMPMWKRLKNEFVRGGRIGELQYIVGALSGERASLFRNGTHLIDALCYLADSPPAWVFAELEAGYEDYTEYRGDGGRTPALEPSASGYIHFASGVRASTPEHPSRRPEPNLRLVSRIRG